MKKIKQPYLYIFLWILGLFLIASVILPQNTPPAAAIASNSTDIEILNNGWKNGNDQSIPSRDVNQKYFTRKLTLPAITKDTLLVIRNSYRGVQILIDQDVRLDYGFSSDNTSLLGNVFVRLPLTPADSRKELTLNFKNNYAKLTSEIEYPMLVSASSFSYHIPVSYTHLCNDLWYLVLCFDSILLYFRYVYTGRYIHNRIEYHHAGCAYCTWYDITGYQAKRKSFLNDKTRS